MSTCTWAAAVALFCAVYCIRALIQYVNGEWISGAGAKEAAKLQAKNEQLRVEMRQLGYEKSYLEAEVRQLRKSRY